VLSSWRSSGFGGVEWARDTVALTMLVALAMPIVIWQYRHRATTWSRIWTCSIAIAGLGLYWWMPWKLAFTIQSWVSPKVNVPPPLQMSIDSTNMRVFALQNSASQLEVDLPLRVTNAPDLSSFRADALSVTFERSDGARWIVPPLFLAQLNPYPQDSAL